MLWETGFFAILNILMALNHSLKTFDRLISTDWIVQSETSSAEKIADINNTKSIIGQVLNPIFESISNVLSSLAILFA